MELHSFYLILILLATRSYSQSVARSILFTDPRLDGERCKLLFSKILQKTEFSSLANRQISPLFLSALNTPPSLGELENQYKVIQNKSILVEIGPDYFYGPSFFPTQSATNENGVERKRITAFDLTNAIQNFVIEAAIRQFVQEIDVVDLAYVFDDTEAVIHPFNKTQNLGFTGSLAGQFLVHRLSDYDDPESVLGQILVDESNILVLNVGQDAALRILRKAEEKNILQRPFSWIVFNAGITLSEEQFNVNSTNFYAIEFSTNGRLKDFPEFNDIPRPITQQDLVFRDTAVKALLEVEKSLLGTVNNATLITSSFGENGTQWWKFYSYMSTNFDQQSSYMVTINEELQMSAGFQDLQAAPSEASLLKLMQTKGLRVGAVVIPPLITEEVLANGTVKLTGSEITLVKELAKRLNVSIEFTKYSTDVGKLVDGKWTGIFGSLQKWDIDLLVGPLSNTAERSATFKGTTPYRSFAYTFLFHSPFMKASVEIFQFTVSFDVFTWLLILVAAVVIAGALAFLHKISPNTLSYNIHSSMIFIFGYLFQGVRTRPPSRLSSQVIIVVWWFFCLVLVIAFCANYAAYRSSFALETLPYSISTLVHQEYYK
ncbi:hypothetical protein Aperf_G00000063283 [Anoplocephala perfoliata]